MMYVVLDLTTRSGPVGSNPVGFTHRRWVDRAPIMPTRPVLTAIAEAIEAAAGLADQGLVTEIRILVKASSVVEAAEYVQS